jgi:RsiW-degrading membrane proteinase PrsW (M82 family)
MKHARRFAWLAVLIADAGLLAWGAMAALAPDYLLGPGSKPILAAGYEGFTGRSWQELMATAPTAAGFMVVLFRVYGAYIVGFGLLAIAVAATAFRHGDAWAWWALLVGNTIAFVSAMLYDWTVGAIGPFEMSEYLGLALIWGALAVTAPFRSVERPVRATG